MLETIATANLPTEFGDFELVGFTPDSDGREHVALVLGDVQDAEQVLTRMHSECLTGDALGSLRCDCRAQLHRALEAIAENGSGVLLYLRQEGRGIGLLNKVRAYELQDGGLDTVDANHALGFPDDLRDYRIGAEMLDALGVRSVNLMTNNPRKVEQLEQHGVTVARRVQHQLPATEHNRFYLHTKRIRAGHLLSDDDPLAAK